MTNRRDYPRSTEPDVRGRADTPYMPVGVPPSTGYAYPGYAYPYGGLNEPQDDTAWASAASAATFLAGVWLIIAPFALDYNATGGGFDGYWNDVTIGIVIALLALVRAVAPREVPWFSVVNVALGAWLLVAPWALGYHVGAKATDATVNDMIVGGVVILAATTSAVLTYRRRSRLRDEARRADQPETAER